MKKVLLIAIFLLSGCNTIIRHCVNFKSDFASDLNLKKYNKCYIISEKSIKTIEGKRVYNQVSEALKKNGIFIQQNKSTANCTIHMNFGTETKSYISNQAVWGNTGYSSSTSHYNPLLNSVSTTYTPSYGITGYIPVQQNVSLHYLSMIAINKKGEEIWNTMAVYDVGEFDRVFPMLLELSMHYLGRKYNNQFCYADSDLILMQQGRNDEIEYLPEY